jgi:hypothetical protein
VAAEAKAALEIKTPMLRRTNRPKANRARLRVVVVL